MGFCDPVRRSYQYNRQMRHRSTIADTPPAVPTRVVFTDPHGRSRRMILRLDPLSHIPPYEQLRAQLAVMVSAGLLAPHSRLPTVRELAEQLTLAPGTVARAYRELEIDGLVEGRGRRGTTVVDEPPGSEPLLERERRLAASARSFVLTVRQLGSRKAAALRAVEAAFDELDAQENG